MPPLPSREYSLFKSVVACYENKTYKRGLKLAESILHKFPKHGDTLAMKGLILNCMGKKKEAYGLVRDGIKNDIQSYVCWHVYGLLYRSDSKYAEAIKCYHRALKISEDNTQILADLSFLQLQVRDYGGFLITREKIFALLPRQRASWIGLVVAYHLSANYHLALQIFECFLETFKNLKQSSPYEYSELVMYKLSIKYDSGDYLGTYEMANSHIADVTDRAALRLLVVTCLIALNRKAEAIPIVEDLLFSNPDNQAYCLLYGNCFSASVDKAELYASLAQEYPRSSQPLLFALGHATEGKKFEMLVGEYLKSGFSKGTPGLFFSLKSMLADEQKASTIQRLALLHLDNCLLSELATGQVNKSPDLQLWIEYFLCQLYDYKGDFEQALQYADRILAHTPTFIDAYVVKARIYKHAGNFTKAANFINEARELDLADRFLNTKCIKYMLLDDRLLQAESIVALFTKEEGNSLSNLVDMQCMWFEQYYGDSVFRLGSYNLALNRFRIIEKHFCDIEEDQLDFHSYCLRKLTLRAYVSMLKMEDDIRSHVFFRRAAKSAIEACLRLDENKTTNGEAYEEAEPRQQINRVEPDKLLRKTLLKEVKQKAADKKKQNGSLSYARPEQHVEPLEEATRFLNHLQRTSRRDIETHLLATRVYMRKGRHLLSLRSLKRAKAIDKNDSRYLLLLVEYALKLNKSDVLDDAVFVVASQELTNLMDGQTVFQFVDAVCRAAAGDAPLSAQQLWLAAELKFLVEPTDRDQYRRALTSICPPLSGSWKDYNVIVQRLKKNLGQSNDVLAYIQLLKEAFPLCGVFNC
ncbi:N-alpha-acetyltransferase 16, NatA auxiliary subunit-like isoform X3 [Zophobas morio]|uniref:N-alpha-acetyltransferase 16, NatA auxiliary subunit-like isoform X3 n=1 Tax=Zophobas morio TaxID=2755281 RepID=UPI003083EB08